MNFPQFALLPLSLVKDTDTYTGEDGPSTVMIRELDWEFWTSPFWDANKPKSSHLIRLILK